MSHFCQKNLDDPPQKGLRTDKRKAEFLGRHVYLYLWPVNEELTAFQKATPCWLGLYEFSVCIVMACSGAGRVR